MKGLVKLEVTHATIVTALQMYFDSVFAEGKSLKILSVKKEQYKEEFFVEAQGEMPAVQA